jgi:hypothetical protein
MTVDRPFTIAGEEIAVMTDRQRLIEVSRRVRGEFLEMPGLRLTPEQARRLWRVDAAACEQVLGVLVDARLLARTRDGAFVRDDGNLSE